MTKITFFGTSDRSELILESLKSNFDLVLCVTKDDVLVGRHQTPKETRVKTWAKVNGIDVVTLKAIDRIKAANAQIGVVADFGYLIPQEILDVFSNRHCDPSVIPSLRGIPYRQGILHSVQDDKGEALDDKKKYGLINVHFSLLPKYRGASPVQYAILNGDTETGITFQLMIKKLDAGSVLSQIKYKLTGTETTGELYEKLFDLSAQALPQVINDYLAGKIVPSQQDESEVRLAPMINKEDARIDWSKSPVEIDRAIRAYHPWPIAWTTLAELGVSHDGDKKVKICTAYLSPANKLVIEKLQVEGGKVLSWNEFKNGYLG